MRDLFILTSMITLLSSCSLNQKYNELEASYETTPVKKGIESTDDAAIWYNKNNPLLSKIIAVNKNKKKNGGNGGLYVYTISGVQRQYINSGALNNVDIRTHNNIDIAVATNRDKKSLSIFNISNNGKVDFVKDIPIKINGISKEPYGLCLHKNKNTNKVYAYLPMKNGSIISYELKSFKKAISAKQLPLINLEDYVTKKQNSLVVEVLYKNLKAENKLHKIESKLVNKFQMEGCVVNDNDNTLFVGMEKLGIWKMNLTNGRPNNIKIFKTIEGSKHDNNKSYILTDDIEGLSLFRLNSKVYLIASIQGNNTYAIFNTSNSKYITSFKVKYESDNVTQTDGITISSSNFGKSFKAGLMVIHDHHNTNKKNEIQNGNYKIISMDMIAELINKNDSN